MLRPVALTSTLALALTFGASLHAATLKVPSGAHPTIQSALTAAQPLDQVVIAKGTYHESLVLVVKSGVTVRGKGKVVIVPPGTDPGLSISLCNGVTIKNLRIVGAQGYGIWVSNADAIEIRGCRVIGGGAESILVDASCKKVTLVGNRVSDADSEGIFFAADHGQIFDNRLTNVNYQGIEVTGAYVTVTGNRVDTTFDEGIFITGANALVADNRVKNAAFTAIDLRNDADGSTVLDCRVDAPAGVGIRVAGDDSVAAGNRVGNGTGSGILVSNSSHAKVLDNRIKGVPVYGIGVNSGCIFALVRENRVRKSGTHGVTIAGTDHSILDNIVARASTDGISIAAGSDRNLVSGNKVSRSQGDGLEVAGNSNEIIANKIAKSGGVDLKQSGAASNNLFAGNKYGSSDL